MAAPIKNPIVFHRPLNNRRLIGRDGRGELVMAALTSSFFFLVIGRVATAHDNDIFQIPR